MDRQGRAPAGRLRITDRVGHRPCVRIPGRVGHRACLCLADRVGHRACLHLTDSVGQGPCRRSGTLTAAAVSATALMTMASGCGSDGDASRDRTPSSPRIVSTIAEGAALSGRVIWRATPEHLARNDFVTFVVFRVDGRERWADDASPYLFQGREWRPGADFLYPETLGRGPHRLEVEATTARGRRIAASVHVSVGTAARAPADLVGTWRRRVLPRDLRAAGIPGGIHHPGAGGGDVTPGVWQLHFAPNGVVHVVGVAGRHYSGTAFRAAGPGRLVLMGPANDARLGERHRFCETPGEAQYRWRVRATTLTLEAISDPTCPGRAAVVSGVWARGR